VSVPTNEEIRGALETVFRDVGGPGFLGMPNPRGTVLMIGGKLDRQRVAAPGFMPVMRYTHDEQHPMLDVKVRMVDVYYPSLFAPGVYVLIDSRRA